MPFKLPRGYAVRLFDRVDTVDSQYSIVDVGLQHSDGGIDSLAVGGSFYSARKAYDNWMSDAEKTSDSVSDFEKAESDAVAS